MLTCIARSKQPSADASSVDRPPPKKPNSNSTPTKQAIKILSTQIKDMALKASGAYRQCAPCAIQRWSYGGGESHSDKIRRSYRRAGKGSSGSNSSSSAGRRQLTAQLKGISSDGMPALASGRRVDAVVFVEESESKEWVAQVEPGVLITFLSLPRGGNDLKQIKFSREMFNKWQAQKWWSENCEKVTELYNVQGLSQQALPTSEDESSPETEDSRKQPTTKPEMETPSSNLTKDADRYGETLIGNTESEWVEEDEPGVYITIRALPHGRQELRRVRFSQEKFEEKHARVWWEENRARIHKKYV